MYVCMYVRVMCPSFRPSIHLSPLVSASLVSEHYRCSLKALVGGLIPRPICTTVATKAPILFMGDLTLLTTLQLSHPSMQGWQRQGHLTGEVRAKKALPSAWR